MPGPTDSQVVAEIVLKMEEADFDWKELPDPRTDGQWKEIYLDRINAIIDMVKQAPSGDPDCPNAPPPPVLT